MYLHLGQSIVVPYRDIIGIFDLDNTSSSHLTRAFLEQAERQKEVINVSEELPKSFVLCCPKLREKQAVYLSQLAPATLLRRAESNSFE
ncbi:MAG: DUF370 domain-containing protein [Oscillospiraceae bacterium]|nr:DUF370 domain-containing protein [Oscillospiraceae bacterium]